MEDKELIALLRRRIATVYDGVDAEAAKFHRELAENFKAKLEKAQAQPTKRQSLT